MNKQIEQGRADGIVESTAPAKPGIDMVAIPLGEFKQGTAAKPQGDVVRDEIRAAYDDGYNHGRIERKTGGSLKRYDGLRVEDERTAKVYAALAGAQPVPQHAPVAGQATHKLFQIWKSNRGESCEWVGGDQFDSFVDQGQYEAFCAGMDTAPAPAASVQPFQRRVQPWMMACFGAEISADKDERNHRFFEESTELVQAYGMTKSEAHQLVDYVYGRPVGEPAQEVGGVMVTLAALCLAQGIDMQAAGETELARIWTKVEAIRAKQAAKPKYSPLPQAVKPASGRDAALLEQAAQACDQQADGTNGPYRSACLQCANALRALRDTVRQSNDIGPTSERDLIVARAIRDAMFNGWNPCREDSDLRGVLAALDKRGA